LIAGGEHFDEDFLRRIRQHRAASTSCTSAAMCAGRTLRIRERELRAAEFAEQVVRDPVAHRLGLAGPASFAASSK
jgi:hypothetical protein